ncbi:helix-turn-helix transcriptional regulator [Nitrospira sp. Ecomares 2.1]
MHITELLTAEQVSATFRFVTPKTLANWRCKGTGPRFVKIGHGVRYRPADVQEWINSRIFTSTSHYNTQKTGEP